MLDNLKIDRNSRLGRIWEFIKTFSDWIILGLGELVAQIIGDVKPFEQMFSVLDPTISFPKAVHEKVSSSMLYVYCFGVPFAVLLVVNLAYGPGNIQRRLTLLNWGTLGLGTSVIFTQVFTEFIKFMIGRPRPDFLSRCQPDLTRVQASLSTTAVTLFNSTICTTTEKKALNDGFRSFPSGHSSMSFAGLSFASLYLAGRFRLFTPHSAHGKHLYAYVLSFAPLLLASYVSTSRVSDFRHRGSDVLGGASLGVIFALLAYRYYFPWLGSRDAGTPWMILREEGAFYDSKAHSRSGSNFGVPLLPTVAPSSQQQTYVDDAGVNTQPIQLNPLPQINVHTPPENPANR